jgi:glycosyltransferase involved in cell wall biosynthesis
MSVKYHIIDPPNSFNPKICEQGLALLLNKAWLTVCKCSIYNYLVLKYFEASACGSVVVGNMASQGKNIWEDNYIHIPDDASDNQIKHIITDALANKEKLRKISETMSQKINLNYSYESFAKKFYNLCNNINSIDLK